MESTSTKNEWLFVIRTTSKFSVPGTKVNRLSEELENIISLLKEYDLRSKGVRSENTTQEENFKELILKICLIV